MMKVFLEKQMSMRHYYLFLAAFFILFVSPIYAGGIVSSQRADAEDELPPEAATLDDIMRPEEEEEREPNLQEQLMMYLTNCASELCCQPDSNCSECDPVLCPYCTEKCSPQCCCFTCGVCALECGKASCECMRDILEDFCLNGGQYFKVPY